MTRHYYIGPLVLDPAEGILRQPDHAVGGISLRQTEFVATDREIDPAAWPWTAYLGDSLTGTLTPAMVRDWCRAVGLPNSDRTNVLALLVERLTERADPAGTSGPYPLIQTHASELELHLGGHSRIWHRRHQGVADPAFPAQRDMYRKMYKGLRGRSLASANHRNRDAHLRFVTDLGERFRCDPVEFIPENRRKTDKPKPKQTSYSDNFNRANETPLAAPWGMLTRNTGGTSAINLSSNAIVPGSASVHHGQYTSAMSSDDHYADLEITALPQPTSARNYWGPCARVYGTGTTDLVLYVFQATIDSSGVVRGRLARRNPSFAVVNAIDNVTTFSAGHKYRVHVDGSTITGYRDTGAGWVSFGSGTDTNIAAVLTAGLEGQLVSGTMIADNWAAADIAAPPSVSAWWWRKFVGG